MSEIQNILTSYSKKNTVRFHMPGHNGKAFGTYLDSILPYDVTETKFTDDLYAPEPNGAVDMLLSKLSGFYDTTATVISAGGATLCLQSAIYCAKQKWGTPFLVDCRCHKSVFNALCLADADVVFFDPNTDISELFKSGPFTVIVTSPDYYGKITDIKKLTELCKKNNSHIIVDNSHGSHLYYYLDGAMHPLRSGADIVIDSIHKTMPAVTGAALLHSKCDIGRNELLNGIRLFGSTSPSYIISASADICCDHMMSKGRKSLSILLSRIDQFENSLSGTPFFRKHFSNYDPFRITLCSHENINMYEVQSYLHKCNTVPEFSDGEHLVLIPSLFSSDSDFDTLLSALKSFGKGSRAPIKHIDLSVPPVFKPVIKPSKTLFAKKSVIDISECINKIAGELKYIYPPGIPYIIPGVILDSTHRDILRSLGIKEITVIEE